MKKWLLLSCIIASFVLFCSDGYADEAQDVEQETQAVDQEAHDAPSRQKVAERIKNQYQVDDQTIQKLRDQKMGYGEITTTLALAKRMDGGITDANIQKIVDLRKTDKKGWGEIAKQFNVKMGDLKKNIHAVNQAANHHSSDTAADSDDQSENQTEKSSWGKNKSLNDSDNSSHGHHSNMSGGASSGGNAGGHGHKGW